MSVNQYFSEVQAVAAVLDGYVGRHKGNESEPFKRPTDEEFTAIWQAVELLSRAYGVLVPMTQLDQAKSYLVLNDPVTVPDEQPELPFEESEGVGA